MKAQAPLNITLTTPQTIPVDETKRAQNSINLKAGFKYGANTNGSRLTLQISNYPSYVENGYSNPLSSFCNASPLPNNPLVGEIEGSFAVSPTGNATYQIPIKMSAGTAGIQPKLNLSYTSGSGSNIMGLDWSFSGLSAITRGSKNPYLDGKYEAISMTLNDVFNIDGNRLLIKAGTYGASGSTYDTEIASFADITANGSQGFGPQSFIVKDKNGTITEYGNSSDAQIVGVGDNTPLVWLVNKVTDEFGNYMTFHYQQLNGETVIKSILYTGNTNAGLTPYNEIVFEYQPKTEKNTFYVGGKEFHSTQLLKSITAKANGDLVKKYTFDYVFSFNTILSAVHEINKDGTEVTPTEFCWSYPHEGNPVTIHNSNLYSGADLYKYNLIKHTIPTDFDGDGFSDLVVVQANNKYDVLHNQYRVNLTNTNNTSADIDFLSVFNTNNLTPSNELLFSTSFDPTFSGKQNVYAIINDATSPNTYHIQEIKNINSPYVPGNSSGGLAINVSNIYSNNLSNPISTILLPSRFYYDKNDYTADATFDELIIDPEKVILNSLMGNTTYNYSSSNSIVRPCDFDGDGSLELLVFKDQVTSLDIDVLKYNAGSFLVIHSKTIAFANNSSANLLKLISIGDFNGDGQTDVLFLNETKQTMSICYSNGKQFLSPKLINSFDALNSSTEYKIASTDINGDAISDIIITSSIGANALDDYITYYSVGDLFFKGYTTQGKLNYFEYEVLKFTPAVTKDFYFPYRVDVIKQKGSNYQMSADFNGDGIYDVMSVDNQFTKIITNNALENKIQYMVKIHSAIGNNINIQYANTNTQFDNSRTLFYSPISGQPYAEPIVSINPNKFVVTRMNKMSDYVGNLSSDYRYLYGGALFHTQGKGFLGFSIFTQINAKTGIGTIASFKPNATYFVPESTKNESAKFSTQTIFNITKWGYDPTQHSQISAQTTNYQITPISSKQIFVAPSNNTEKDYLSSTASITNLTYDLNQKGSIINSTTTDGWQGQPLIKTEQTNYTYQNINGIFKPQSVASTSTQNGEPSYSRTKEFAYDGAGHLTGTTNDPTFGSQSLVTTYQDFNAFGSPTKATITAGDILPRTSQTLFDATGRFITKTINPKGDVEEFVYEPNYGTLSQKKDISGLISKYYYDGLGRLIKTLLPDNTTNTIEYKWASQPTSFSRYYKTVKNEGEAYNTTYYNYLGQVASTETIDFNGNVIVTENNYNYLNLLLEESSEPHFASQTDNYLVTKYTYDHFLRPLKTEIFKKTGAVNSYTSKNIFSNYSYNTTSVDLSFGTQYNEGFTKVTDQTNKSILKKNNAAGQETITENTQTTGSGVIALSNTQTSIYEFNSNGNPKKATLTYSDLPDVITHSFSYNNLGQQTQLIDPSAGTINYQYNTLGELLQQQDANGTWDYTYDNIGRVLTRNGSASGLSTYEYVTAIAGKNKLQKITGQNVITEYTYDNLSRPITFKETVNSTGKIFTSATQYDTYSRVSQQTHTGGFVTKYSYATTGELLTIKNASNQLLWQRNDQNALGQITDYNYGNGINTTKVYNDLHQLNEINHGAIHKQTYAFDALAGNLIQRDFENSLTATHNREKFAFDALDRLNQAKQTDPANMDAFIYANNTTINSKGNIEHKDDAGDFLYNDPNKPFSITQINNPSPLIPTNALSTTINDLRKVNQIAEAVTNKEMNFIYGNDDERIKVDYLIGGIKQYTRYYQTNYDYQEDATGANTKEWTYIYAPTGLLAVYYKQNTTSELLYALTDHLGSPLMLTNQAQNIVEEYSFDAWGRRRNPVDWSYTAITPSILNRGFTFHEHIDEFNLINMNGRVYDPTLGRFLQPDNQVQIPDYIQTFNKYAYAFNNPLSYTDPSGWSAFDINSGLSAEFSNYDDAESGGWASGGGGGGDWGGSGFTSNTGAVYQEYAKWFASSTASIFSGKFSVKVPLPWKRAEGRYKRNSEWANTTIKLNFSNAGADYGFGMYSIGNDYVSYNPSTITGGLPNNLIEMGYASYTPQEFKQYSKPDQISVDANTDPNLIIATYIAAFQYEVTNGTGLSENKILKYFNNTGGVNSYQYTKPVNLTSRGSQIQILPDIKTNISIQFDFNTGIGATITSSNTKGLNVIHRQLNRALQDRDNAFGNWIDQRTNVSKFSQFNFPQFDIFGFGVRVPMYN